MAGGWKSNSETGPSIPQDFGGDSDHGAAKLSRMVKEHPNYTHGEFLGTDDYGVDRLNRKDVSTATPTVDKHGTTSESAGPKGDA